MKDVVILKTENVESGHPLFKMRRETRKTSWNPNYTLDYVQCPVCSRWFNYYVKNDFRGVKLHIRKWATKEATANALGEIKKSGMNHLKFWKAHTEVVQELPKAREWKL